MIKIFLACIAANITSFAQIELSGRVFDEKGLPLKGVHIRVEDPVAETHSDSLGRFQISISTDSAIVNFSKFPFRRYKFKVFVSQSIEIKLRDIFYPHVTWNIEDSDKPLYKEKDKQGITRVYGSEIVVLPTKLSANKVVLWKHQGYEIILPFDSLRAYVDKVGYSSDANFDQNMFKDDAKSDTVLLSGDVVNEVGKSTLIDLAINMLKSRSIVILDKDRRHVPTVTVRHAYWHGRRCNLCFWSGLQFVVPDAKEPLFEITHIIS